MRVSSWLDKTFILSTLEGSLGCPFCYTHTMNAESKSSRYRPAPVLVILTVTGLGIFMILDLMLIPAGLIGMHGLGIFNGEPRNQELVDLATIVRGFSALGQLAMFVFTPTVFCMLMYRCAKNARSLGFDWLDYTPGWVVGWFFVPFAHLWMPYKAVGEVWQTSLVDPDELPSSEWRFNSVGTLFNAWWATWVFGTILTNIASRMSRSTTGFETMGLCITPFAALIQVLSGLLCILVVLKITKRQDQQARFLSLNPQPTVD